MTELGLAPRKWYSGITGYQWLVLAIASAGWIFDVFRSYQAAFWVVAATAAGACLFVWLAAPRKVRLPRRKDPAGISSA